MSKPTTSIFPLENAKLLTELDANNLQIVNLDTSNLGLAGGSGNDTGTTTAILKGDGNHGFDDAVDGTDYLAPAGSGVNLTGVLKATSNLSDVVSVPTSRANLGLGSVDNTADADKPLSTADIAALALKADDATVTAYIASNDAAVALKADDAATTTALATKASTSALTTGLALKEPILPTTSNDDWILAKKIDGTYHFVDPVTLGTTSQSFTDGVSNTSTTYTSASAAFVANDVGKTITGTDIPASTTIASRTNGTTIVLSQAATGTHTGNSFTIINRLLVASSGGTVTNVAVTNNATALFTTGVTNPTASAAITITALDSLTANTFYGVGAGGGTASFLSASVTRTALGGGTVGQALFLLNTPAIAGYARLNADNTVTARTFAQTLIDLGTEASLVFNAPLVRAGGTPNTISIPAATTSVAGHLTAADWTTFNNKVPGTRKIVATTPLTVSPTAGVLGGASGSDLILAMPAANSIAVPGPVTSGYLTSADHATFLDKPPNARRIDTTSPLTGGGDLSANRTLAMTVANSAAVPATAGYLSVTDHAHFALAYATSPQNFIAPAGGSILASSLLGPPIINRILLTTPLTSDLTINLPAAVNYGAAVAFRELEIVDIVGNAQANFGITLQRTGTTDLIDGNSTPVALSRGANYFRLVANGSNLGGKWVSTNYFVKSIRDPSSNLALTFNLSSMGANSTFTATGNCVGVLPTAAPDDGAIYGATSIDGTGTIGYSQILPAPVEGKVVKVVGGVYALAFPAASDGWSQLAEATPIVWTPTNGQTHQYGYISLTADRTLEINASDPTNALVSGMVFHLLVQQDATGGRHLAFTTAQKQLTSTPSVDGGLGVLQQTLTANALDWYTIEYTGIPGINFVAKTQGLDLTHAVPPACSVASSPATGATTGTSILTVGATTGTGQVYRSSAFVASDTAICGVTVNLFKNGAPSYPLNAAIHVDAIRVNGTYSSGAPSSGSSTYTDTTAVWTGTDLGQHINIASGFPATDYFIGAVLSTTSITVSSTRPGSSGNGTPVNATSSPTGVVSQTYGIPGAIVNAGSTNAPSASSLPQYATAAGATAAGFPGAPNADQNPTSFSGLTATAMTVGRNYHLLIWGTTGTPNGIDYISWLYSPVVVPGFAIRSASQETGATWGLSQNKVKARFQTYHT